MIAAKPMFLFALMLSSVVADHPFRAAQRAVERARLQFASLRAPDANEGSAALLQDNEDGPVECEEIMDVVDLIETSGCYDIFMEGSRPNNTVAGLEEGLIGMCSSCDFDGVGELLDALSPSCHQRLWGLGPTWGMINAFCSTDPDSGELCASGLALLFAFDVGKDTAVEACEKTTCSELFFQNWVDNHLTGETCHPFLIETTQICVQVDGEYCVGRELALFVKGGSVEYDDAHNLCNSYCGQAFIDGIAAEYAEHEECYSEGIHTPPELHDLYCNQTADGDYCIVEISALADEFFACAEYISESDYMSQECSSECAYELKKLANDLGCCASLAPKYIHDAPEDAETFTAWANAQCDVDFTKCGSGEQGGCGECEEVIHHEIRDIREELLRIQYEAFDEAANRIAEAMMMHGDY